jgi:hypothetical protein
MGSQVTQARTLRQLMFHQVAGRLGEQDLSSVAGVHDARRSMHIQTHVALGSQVWLTGVQTHAQAHRHSFGPRLRGQGPLGLYRR